MAVGDLAKLDAVKTFVGVAGSDVHDAVLSALITAASAWLSQFCNRSFPSHAVSAETRNGTGGPCLMLREAPAISITSLTIDDRPIPARAGAFSSGYVLDAGIAALWLTGYRFTKGVGNVVVSYTAGFETLPSDVSMFCQQIVAEQFRYRDRTGQSTTSLNGQNVSFKDEDIPKFIRTGLVEGGWKRVVRP